MKRLMTIFSLLALVAFVGCKEVVDEPIIRQTTSLTISYRFDANTTGESMTKGLDNKAIFNEFYAAINDGSLIPPTYDLTFKEKNTGETFVLNGSWNKKEAVEIRMGSYIVSGTATAKGAYIQDKCSLVIKDTEVEIDRDDMALTFKADYDCALIIFADDTLVSVTNCTNNTESNFFTFSDYHYAFVNDTICEKGTDSYLLGVRDSGAQFTIQTTWLPFEKGKFYVYDTAKTNSFESTFSVPEMEEGNVYTRPINEIWYTSTDGDIVEPYKSNNFGANIISNTYSNGRGVITFDGVVKSIGQQAFSDCSSLASITIPEGVTSIREVAFEGCSSLASITIPEGVTSIGSSAFYNCSSLTSITIPEGVTSIGVQAFSGCSSLTSITIPEGVTSIGWYAFFGCSSLASITIPEGVTSIGECAFWGCSSLTSITIPESVVSIGEQAFSGCSSLASITIPESVTSIGIYAFRYCIFKEDEFKNNSSLDAEANNYWGARLFNVIQEDGLYINGTTAVACRTNATSVTIPEGVTSIGEGAFEGCSSLTSITIPESVTSIGKSAFRRCSSLASITIPEGVASIGVSAFYECSSLAEVYCKPTTPPTADFGSNNYWRAFGYNASGRKIYVPTESVDAYKTAEGWSEYANAIEGYDF